MKNPYGLILWLQAGADRLGKPTVLREIMNAAALELMEMYGEYDPEDAEYHGRDEQEDMAMAIAHLDTFKRAYTV